MDLILYAILKNIIMTTIKLKDTGTSLRSRLEASFLRKKVMFNDSVEFDFDGVSLMTHSFCDELIGGLFTEKGEKFFKDKVTFKNVSSENKSIIKRTIISRKESLIH